MGDFQPCGCGWDEFGKEVCPFADDDGVFIEVFVPAEGGDFCGGFEAVEVEMEDGDGAAAVFVDDGEGGAGGCGGGVDAGYEAF